MAPPATTTRTLSTAEERREAVIVAGMRVMSERGIHATPTMEVAKAAGISQAYLFRLFPTKAELAVAVIERCNQRIHETFAAAAAQARVAGEEDILHAMGESYSELIQDRTLLLLQLHAHAAAPSEPAIGEVMRRGFSDLYALIKRESGAAHEDISHFFATGMLINTLAAIGAYEVDEQWAQDLCQMPQLDDPQ